tara:strand:+ start:491 stop:685 length:195 start_codon:yes stop_codon:yes gene_type:complete
MPGFTFQLDKSDRMTIFHHGRAIKVLKPREALKLEERMHHAPEDERQRMMAAATGNYKRGNEKP